MSAHMHCLHAEGTRAVFAEERQQTMAELVRQRGRVAVTDLAREFEVTTETVRRDLSALEGLRLIRRVHGGAIPLDSATLPEARLSDRDVTHVMEKQRIAEAALRFLPSTAATVLLDAGSTTMRLAQRLPRDGSLTVMTHAVPLAAHLAESGSVDLFVLPGRVRTSTLAAVGVETVAALERIRADVAFVGTNGLTLRHGLSTPDHAEAATKAQIIASAHTVVVLTDSSKFGVERTVRFAELADVDVVITDAGAPKDVRLAMSQAGIEVVIA